MGLSAHDRTRYARHLLLPQLGEAGQARLLATRLRAQSAADLGVLEVARTYLVRSGVTLVDAPRAGAQDDTQELPLPTESEVARVAGRPALTEAARALLGALAAVDAIRTATGLGTGAGLPEHFAISSEEA